MLRTLPLLALTLLIAAVALLQTAGPVEARSNIVWRDCFEETECGRMKVPLEHNKPASGDIELALVRFPALDQEQRIGSLVVNFGGPGGATVDTLLNGGIGFFPDELRDRFDIVGFDPRGVGQSSAIDCIDNFDDFVTDASPDTSRERDKAIQEARAFGEDCQRRSGALIQFVNSEAAARDMDLIREELGDEKLTYLGFSYGTFLGATYAEFFPDRVRALLLDGAIATDLQPEEDVLQQAMGFEIALDSFFSVCAADPDCAFKAPDLEAAFESMVANAEATPLEGWFYPITGNEILNAAAGAMYHREDRWLLLSEALRQAHEEHAGVGIGALLDGGRDDDESEDAFTNPYEAFIAISCVDFWAYRSEQHFRSTLEQAPNAAPHFGELFVYSTLPCVFWPGAERRIPRVYAAAGAPPILVVGTLRDPATPYVWSQGLAAGLESAVLLTFDGDGHTAFGYGNECIDGYGVNYLVELTLPADGTVCAGVYGDTFPPSGAPVVPSEPAVPAAEPATGTIQPPDTGSRARADERDAGMLVAFAAIALGALGVAGVGRRLR